MKQFIYVLISLMIVFSTINIQHANAINVDQAGKVSWIVQSQTQAHTVVIDKTYVSAQRCDVGTRQSVRFHARWGNGSDVTGGSIQINDDHTLFNSSRWAVLTDISLFSAKKVYFIKAVNCSGVTDFTQPSSAPFIVWDRVEVALTIDDDRIDIGSNASLHWTAAYESDGSPFQGKVNIQVISNQISFATAVGKGSYRVESIEDSKYGLTAFTSNQVDCVWDRVKIAQSGVSSQLTRTGNMETVWFKAVYEYDGEEFTGEPNADGGMNKMFVNNVPLTWSSFDRVWKYSTKLDDNGKLTFEVTGVEDMQYKLTKFVDAGGPQSITWEKPFLETPVGMVSVAAMLAIIVAGVIFFLRKRI